MIFVATTIVISLSQNLIQIIQTHALNQSSHPFVLCLGVVEILPGHLIWYSVLVSNGHASFPINGQWEKDGFQVLHDAEYRLNN